jgi:hypothetical protein
MMPMAAGLAMLPLLALLAGGGCSEDFPPFNHLRSLRVLAIQSEPAAPLSGETSTITPLVFTPDDDPSLTYAWSWCPAPGPAESGHQCLISEDELRTILGPDVPFPSFDLGMAPTAMLQNGLPPELLAAICAGAAPGVPRPNCAGGFPVQVSLRVTTDTDQVDSVVTGRWRFDPDAHAPNANPVVDGLTAKLPGADPQPLTSMLADDTITLPRKTATRVDAAAAPEASETYAGLDDDGVPATLRERLFITWFVEGGDTDDSRTSYIPDRTPFETMLRNVWTVEEKRLYARDDARIYVVLHDNRGGVGWSSGIVKLGPTP